MRNAFLRGTRVYYDMQLKHCNQINVGLPTVFPRPGKHNKITLKQVSGHKEVSNNEKFDQPEL